MTTGLDDASAVPATLRRVDARKHETGGGPFRRLTAVSHAGPSLLVSATVLFAGVCALARLGDNDIWWHIRLGDDLIHQRSLAAPDWSPLATQAWTPTEPLLEIVGAWLQGLFGWAAIKWLLGVGLVGLVLATYFCMRRVAGRGPASVCAVAVFCGCSLSLSPRPQLASFALIAVVVSAWFSTEKDAKPRWWLVPLTWLWSLVHGMWIFGVGYSALFVIAIALSRQLSWRQVGKLALIPLLSLVVVTLNPAGLGVVEAPFTIPGYGRWVAEWGHTQPVGTLAALTVEVMVLETIGLWILNRQRLPWSRVLLMLSAIVWLYYAYRTVAVAAVVTGPLLAEAIQVMTARTRAEASTVVAVKRGERGTLLGVALATLTLLALVVPHTSMQPKYVPTRLDPVLDRLPAGTVVFNNYGIGGWIIWRHPDLHPVIDGLATPYSVQWFDEFHAALDAKPGWMDFVRRTGATATLLSRDFVLPDKLEQHGWVLLGKDGGYMVLVRPDLARQLGAHGSAS